MAKRHIFRFAAAFLSVLFIALALPQLIALTAYAEDDSSDKKLCAICQKLKDEDELCPTCGICDDCIVSNGNAEIHCADCDACVTTFGDGDDGCAKSGQIYCDDCLKDEYLHCPGCGDCYCENPDMLCEECHLCNSCCAADEAGNQYVCDSCHRCSGCQQHCPVCEDCEYERCPMELPHCLNECELCSACELICFHESDEAPCEYCGLCEECCEENRCPDCGMCCEDPSYDTHFCADCGECLETVGEVCDNCGLCLECCRIEAENLGCSCGELCFEDVNDEHVCVNCGVCFGMTDSCPDCGLCVDCCEDVSRIEGCDCDRPVCVESDDWKEHFNTHHAGFAGVHTATPGGTWSFDASSHWRECKYCDEASHISQKAAHSFDRNGRCTVCAFSNTEPIVIGRQPMDLTVKVSDWRAGDDDDLNSKNNTARFSVTAYGKNLTYTWFRYGGTPMVDRFEALRVSGQTNLGDDNETVHSKSLVDNVSNDSCLDGVYYYRCYISDGEHGMWTDAAAMTIEHCYTILSEESPIKAGHYMQCHGEGCDDRQLVPHVYTHWEWSDNTHTVRTQVCDVCGYNAEVVLHDHAEWVRTFFAGKANFEDENHDIEFDPGTSPDNWYQTGNMNADIGEPNYKMACTDAYGYTWTADWNYHTGWCYCDDCFSNPMKVRELHHFNSWQGSNNPPKAGEAGIIYRVCGDCGYVQYATDENGNPVEWRSPLHPVEYINCHGPNKFVSTGSYVTFFPDKVPGRIHDGWRIRYYIYQSDGSYTYGTQELAAGASNWQIPQTVAGAGRIEVIQLFSASDCMHSHTERVGVIEAPCGKRGYTGDIVCADCGQLITKGEPTEYRSHGELITVTQDVYRTDKDGEVMYNRYGEPVILARGPHAADCVTHTDGNEADRICSVCGLRVERGKTKRWEALHEGRANIKWDSYVSCTDAAHPVSDKYICKLCGDEVFVPRPQDELIEGDELSIYHVHLQQTDVEPGCTTSGQRGGAWCPDCGRVFLTGETIAPTGHTWDEGVLTAPNRRTYTCTSCGAIKTEILYTASVTGSVSGTTLRCTVVKAPAGAKLFAVWYDAAGRMLGMTSASPAAGNSTNSLTVGSGAAKYKLMLLDGADFAPLCPAWESDGQ